MAPAPPSARLRRLARISGAEHPLAPPKTFRPDAAVSDSFLASKRDRRLIKHSSFVARIASAPGRVVKPEPKTRRRAGVSLDALARALPDLLPADAAPSHGKVRHRSLKSKPGALRRKERLVRGEMERFGASMARLTGPDSVPRLSAASDVHGHGLAQRRGRSASSQQQQQPHQHTAAQQPTTTTTTNRWAALRGYISATMERNPAFVAEK